MRDRKTGFKQFPAVGQERHLRLFDLLEPSFEQNWRPGKIKLSHK